MPGRAASFGWAAAAAALCAALLTACGGSGRPSRVPVGRSRTVVVASSLPAQGPEAPQAQAIVSGIRLALEQANGRAGRWSVRYEALDDTTAAGDRPWQTAATVASARRAAIDPATVLDIGELDSGASEVSAPILNEAGIPQLSPGSPATGLTAAVPGVTPTGQPARYQPTGSITFVRLLASDTAEAAAELLALRDAGCSKLAVLAGPGYAEARADAEFPALLRQQAGPAELNVVLRERVNGTAASMRALTIALRRTRPGCVALAAVPGPATSAVTEQVHYTLLRTRIMGIPALCDPGWTNPADGGVPADVEPVLGCTQPTIPVRDDPAGTALRRIYEARYGRAPTPAAATGYAAMQIALQDIAAAGGRGDDRDVVRANLLAPHRAWQTVLGPIGFAPDGDATPVSVGLYDVGRSGDPGFTERLVPTLSLRG